MTYGPTSPNPMPPVTRNWAMSALILSILTLLLTLPNLFQVKTTILLMGSKAPLYMCSMIVSLLTTIAFITTSAATLQGRTWGREGLSYTALMAILVTIFGCVLTWTTINDPHYMTAMMTMMAARQPNGGLPPSAMQGMVTMIVKGTLWAAGIMGAVQIVYCGLLYKHMSAEPELPEIAYDPSSRPPAPQG
jgi:hypothetical protein